MQHHWNLPVYKTGRVLAAEQFLQPHSQDGQIWSLVFYANIRTAGDS